MIELTLYVLYGLLTTISIIFVFRLMFAFKHFTMKTNVSVPSMLKDLPSVTVCLPARNEKDAMTQCLERVIASRYPKLEIIVLDDSSADNTSILIKSFARAGVRFVEGSDLPAGWLGKNHALQELLEESSGTYILYMDVDTHIEPDTIGELVAYAQSEKADMVSVLPRREDGWRTSVLLSTLRYFWAIILHRQSHPAVASSAWLINRRALVEVGGVELYKDDVQPEARIAATFSARNAYRFIIGTPLIGVSYEKKWQSQIDTSVRLLFPLLGKNMMLAILTVVFLLLLQTPLIALAVGLFDGWTLVQSVALWQLCLFVALYGMYLGVVWRRAWWFGALLWPVVLTQEIIVLIISVIRYKRQTVTWKGRSITSLQEVKS